LSNLVFATLERWSRTKKRALSLQVRDPHSSDHVPVIVRLLICTFVAGPNGILLGRKGLFFLLAIRSSPSVIWQTMAFIIGGPAVFDPGCMMTSSIETVLKPGMRDGVSPS
jgi:hypothetical protein